MMLISEVIEKLKQYHQGYGKIDPATTRDQILYGNPDQECTGIVTCIWPSIQVIEKAIELNANLIVSHEALFWNHGDHQEWLKKTQNQTYLEKKALLDGANICVWRDHDYIHSGIPMTDGTYADGIFYGLARELGWEDYLTDHEHCLTFHLPKTTVGEVANTFMEKLGVDGMKLVGKEDQPAEDVEIIFHVLGDVQDMITKADKQDTSLLVAMELIDFTLTEYVRDSFMLGKYRAILCMGHFNTEEPGMKYCLEYFPKAIGEDIPCTFVSAGDMYTYLKNPKNAE